MLLKKTFSGLVIGLFIDGMQDSSFTNQPRLHDFPPFWQSISIGNGCEAKTLTLKFGVYLTRPFSLASDQGTICCFCPLVLVILYNKY